MFAIIALYRATCMASSTDRPQWDEYSEDTAVKTPSEELADYMPFQYIDEAIETYHPLRIYLNHRDVCFLVAGMPEKVRFKIEETCTTLRQQYRFTMLDGPVKEKYDESLVYGDDHTGRHEDCWVDTWEFLKTDMELAENERVFAFSREYWGDAVVFEFGYFPQDVVELLSPFENIEVYFCGDQLLYAESVAWMNHGLGLVTTE
jgi:hypothetical protein